MSDVSTCQSEYLASDDLKGKIVTAQIAQVLVAPKLPGSRKGPEKKAPSVLIIFAKGSKGWVCNPTNQWAMAVLFGSKKASDWVGKRVSLRQDVDVDIESGAKCMTIRVHGSPDASPDRTKTYNEAWDDGPRQRGALCRRLKRAYRLMVPDAGETQTAAEPETTEQEEQS